MIIRLLCFLKNHFYTNLKKGSGWLIFSLWLSLIFADVFDNLDRESISYAGESTFLEYFLFFAIISTIFIVFDFSRGWARFLVPLSFVISMPFLFSSEAAGDIHGESDAFFALIVFLGFILTSAIIMLLKMFYDVALYLLFHFSSNE